MFLSKKVDGVGSREGVLERHKGLRGNNAEGDIIGTRLLYITHSSDDILCLLSSQRR